jgi:hypothetical protein
MAKKAEKAEKAQETCLICQPPKTMRHDQLVAHIKHVHGFGNCTRRNVDEFNKSDEDERPFDPCAELEEENDALDKWEREQAECAELEAGLTDEQMAKVQKLAQFVLDVAGG